MSNQPDWPQLIIQKVFNRVASVITGIDNKNAYLIDNALDKPINKAAVIVIPDRETPGIRAKA